MALFDLAPTITATNTPIDLNDLAAVEAWADNEHINHQRVATTAGDCLVLSGSLGILPNPVAESSEALRALQREWTEAGKSLYYVYFWDVDTHKLLAHFKSKLGLDERKYAAKRLHCEVIPNKVGDAFMTTYHIQGSARGTDKVSIALKDKKTHEILAVQQFAKYRFGVAKGQKRSESTVWEGLRLCFLPGVQIHGGASRLQKAFEKEYNPTKVIGYISLSHSDGSYKAFQGFEDLTDWNQLSYMWVLEGTPTQVPIVDKNGVLRVNDLDESLRLPVINPNQLAGVWGKGVGQLFYGGKLGSRKELRGQVANGELVHNDVILEAIGYKKRFTPGQAKWSKTLWKDALPENTD